MEEKRIVKRETIFVGREPYIYDIKPDVTVLESDSGFGKAGAKLDPKTGALMHDKYAEKIYEETIRRQREAKAPPPPKPVEVPGIRFSANSQAMINIKEEEETTISESGEVRGHRAKGIISVVNLSDKDRIWDVGVSFIDKKALSGMESDTLNAIEIEPGQKKSKEYRIDIERPSIMIEESISTHPDYPRSIIIQKDKPTKARVQIRVQNVAIIPYNNIVIKKTIPAKLKNVNFPDRDAENVELDGDMLVWRITELGKGSSRVLKYEGDLEPEGSNEIPIGDITLDGSGQDTLTSFVITNFNAMCRNMYYIEVDETEDVGEWVCRFVCDNSSTYEVEILKVEVVDTESGEAYLNVDRPGVRIPVGKQWVSHAWKVKSDTRPRFIKNFIINVIPGLEKQVYYRLRKDGGLYHVAGLNFRKSFDQTQVVAGRNTDIMTRFEIENTGSAALDQIFIRDLIPKYMMPPKMAMVEVLRGSVPLKNNVRLIVEPEDESPQTEQKVLIHIQDLTDHGGPFMQGEKLLVTYRTPVIRPEPEMRFIAPAEVDGKPELPGPVVSAIDIAGAPVINVQQIVRKFSIGKSIVHGANVGEYHIGLLYKNRGNRPIENLMIKDNIPQNFTAQGFTIEPSHSAKASDGSTMVQWDIPTVKEGETIGITYIIKGQGEYHPRDAQIFYNASD